MQTVFVILFMMVIGALIGGLTNFIAIKMLFHPYKAHYIFGYRVPFTPGLIPKRRKEVSQKIGQVIEEHLLTESLIKTRLMSSEAKTALQSFLQGQVQKLKRDDVTLQSLAQHVDINLTTHISKSFVPFLQEKLNAYYHARADQALGKIIPASVVTQADDFVETLPTHLCTRARQYLTSEKGQRDISEMITTFFNEKGRFIGMLQMFMTKEAIAEKIQAELLRLTEHPKAQEILSDVIHAEYDKLKDKALQDVVSEAQFMRISDQCIQHVLDEWDVEKQIHRPLHRVFPNLIQMLEQRAVGQVSDLIMEKASTSISTMMQKLNLRQLIETQIDSFELDYIERLIIEISNKELKLIMVLGFILGGIIGLFQGVIAIFV